jgi:15-cis-phytoene synthase
MSASDARTDSVGFCADLVRTHDFARYASTLFMPAAQRRALLSIYAFNAEISRVRDQVSQPLPGEMRLQWWTDMLAAQAMAASRAIRSRPSLWSRSAISGCRSSRYPG